MQYREHMLPALARADRAYAAGEITGRDMAGVYRALADEASARAATIIPNTKASAWERGVALGQARALTICAAYQEERAAVGVRAAA